MLQALEVHRPLERPPATVVSVDGSHTNECHAMSVTDGVDGSLSPRHVRSTRPNGRYPALSRNRGIAGMSIATALRTDALMDLVEALRELGATISLPTNLVEAAHANGQAHGRVTGGPTPLAFGEALTDTEVQILRYLPTHLTVQEIATEQCRSADTIKTHVRHLYIKLDAHNRSQAVRNARAAGLLA
jgi:DNA-binding CsgD family transcriptional regulator